MILLLWSSCWHIWRACSFAGPRTSFVCMSDFNHLARRFYERNGYTEIEPILHLLILGSSEILLRKTTGPAKSV